MRRIVRKYFLVRGFEIIGLRWRVFEASGGRCYYEFFLNICCVFGDIWRYLEIFWVIIVIWE